MNSSIIIALISFGCIVSGALLGLLFQKVLPEDHLRDASKDTVKVAAATIATLSALVVGLLVGSAKSSLDSANAAITQSGAKIILLDRALSNYGPESKPARDELRQAVVAGLEMFWPEEKTEVSGLSRFERATAMEKVLATLRELTPATDLQRQLLPQAEQLANEILQARWLAIEQAQVGLPMPFLVVLLFWLTMLHLSFGLFAPHNTTVLVVFLISALSLSGAIFIIMEMNRPLEGMIRMSSAPMHKALEHLGK